MFSQIATSVTILNSGLIGYCGVSLTNFDSSALSAIAAGSSIEIAGAFFKADADVTINASSWTAITTATTAYLHLTPSGTAGSQIISAAWSSTVPDWSTSKQGWYASSGSSTRVIASAYKSSATQQELKRLIPEFVAGGKQIFTSSGTFIAPHGVSYVYVTGCAAGGKGGDISSTSITTLGAGGGGGGEVILKRKYLLSSRTVTVTIGGASTNTSFGVITLNYGLNAPNTLAFPATAGAGGAKNLGDFAGGAGGGVVTSSTASAGSNTILCYGGSAGTTYYLSTAASYAGGGGGGASLGFAAAPYSTLQATGTNGGATGFLGGGGGGSGGGYGGSGGIGGWGSGGGGASATAGNVGGSGGSAIIIVEY